MVKNKRFKTVIYVMALISIFTRSEVIGYLSLLAGAIYTLGRLLQRIDEELEGRR